MDAAWIEQLAVSPWLLPVLFLLVICDAFLVVLPSETAVVALGSLAAVVVAIVLGIAVDAIAQRVTRRHQTE